LPPDKGRKRFVTKREERCGAGASETRQDLLNPEVVRSEIRNEDATTILEGGGAGEPLPLRIERRPKVTQELGALGQN